MKKQNEKMWKMEVILLSFDSKNFELNSPRFIYNFCTSYLN